MNKTIPLLMCLSVLLVACGPDTSLSSLPSPNGQYHVEVRKCPEAGSIAWSEKLQVSVLASGVSAKCQDATHALVQFDALVQEDQLQLAWMTDTQLRAWYPGINPDYGPDRITRKANVPVEVVFTEH
ncbi:hypothetical protein [Pseudomonas cichorii]|nr:hypothetical protein [Pseudomonas cichorii]